MAAESAAQLFSRLGARQSLEGLDEKLFADIPHGLQAGDVVEFYGKEGCGKTEMLLHLIANCILPKCWKDLYLGGRGVSVIFVNADYHFQLLRLITIMEHRIQTALVLINKEKGIQWPSRDSHVTLNGQRVYPDGYNDCEGFVKLCLGRLFIVNCNSSIELLATILSLEQMIFAKPEVCIVMIDSLSAFYWVDRSTGGESTKDQEENIRKTIEALSKYSKENNLVILTTKHTIFSAHGSHDQSSTNQNYFCKSWQQVIKYRYAFGRQTEYDGKSSRLQNVFVVQRTTPLSEKFHKFYIGEHGVEFIS